MYHTHLVVVVACTACIVFIKLDHRRSPETGFHLHAVAGPWEGGISGDNRWVTQIEAIPGRNLDRMASRTSHGRPSFCFCFSDAATCDFQISQGG